MEWKRNKKRNQKIKEMRLNGFSIKDIALKLKCGKSTVSYHCKGIVPKTLDRINRNCRENTKRSAEGQKKFWGERRAQAASKAKTEWNRIYQDAEMMGFLGLYWGDGYKSSGKVGISNQDPDLVGFCWKILKNITKKVAVARITYYETHDPKLCERHWRKALGKHVEIRMQKNNDARSKNQTHSRCQYGRCQLEINDWELYTKIMTWLACWKARM